MGKPKKKKKVKVRVKQSAKLVHRNDATIVESRHNNEYPVMKPKLPRSAAPVFKIKVKKKKRD